MVADYQVFVSHATDDKWIATQMCEHVKRAGAKFFRDDHAIDAGDQIPEQIRTGIRRSQEFLVLLSPSSKDRAWVHAEVGAAWLLKRRIVVVLCHVKTNTIPAMLASEKAININDLGAYISELKERLKKHNTRGISKAKKSAGRVVRR
ncbi:MAG: toll/interleukin-1 receptor domain-containing protein [Tepidisphaeraceae bacterium]